MKCRTAFLLMLAFALSSCGQSGPDHEMCKSGLNLDQRIEACTRLISSGQLSRPDQANAYHSRGAAWASRRDYGRAIADYDEALRLNPIHALAHFDRFMAGRDKAASRTSSVPRKDSRPKEAPSKAARPAETVDYVERGLAWAQNRNYDRAIADYTQALQVNPKDPRAHMYRAAAWSNKGNYERAIADYTESMRLNPQHAGVHNSAAWLLATAPIASVRNGTRAVEVARKAAELSAWKDGNVLDTLAAAYAEAGNFAEAVRWQEQATKFPDFMQDQGDGARARLELYRKRQPFHQQ